MCSRIEGLLSQFLISFRSRKLEFLQNERGSVALIFALMFVVMLIFVGAAVDIGRWLDARTRTFAAIDAGVLAGGRFLQINRSDTAAAIASAAKFYRENVVGRREVINDTIQFHPTPDQNSFMASGNAFIKTPFLSIAGIDKLPLLSKAGSDFAVSKIAVGGNAETSNEIALMLDITGSMGGQKIADLKAAAKDLIDIVVWEDQSRYTSRIALVPFSETVNVGSYAANMRGPLTTGTCTTPGCARYTFTRTNGSTATYSAGTCVTERTGTAAYTDAAPSLATTRVGLSYPSSGGTCNPTNTIVPLTNDTAALKSAIDSYSAPTAIPLDISERHGLGTCFLRTGAISGLHKAGQKAIRGSTRKTSTASRC